MDRSNCACSCSLFSQIPSRHDTIQCKTDHDNQRTRRIGGGQESTPIQSVDSLFLSRFYSSLTKATSSMFERFPSVSSSFIHFWCRSAHARSPFLMVHRFWFNGRRVGELEGGGYMFKFASQSEFTHTECFFFDDEWEWYVTTLRRVYWYLRSERTECRGYDASKTWSRWENDEHRSNSIQCVSSHTKTKTTLHRRTLLVPHTHRFPRCDIIVSPNSRVL